MINILMVGGPSDGEYWPVDISEAPPLYIFKPAKMLSYEEYFNSPFEDFVQNERYILEKLVSRDSEHWLYRYEHIKIEQVLAKLLENYISKYKISSNLLEEV